MFPICMQFHLTLEPLKNLLLIPLHPLDVGFGSFQGLLHRQGGRAETCNSMILDKLLQLPNQCEETVRITVLRVHMYLKTSL